MDWFAVDKAGLARLLERQGKAHAVLELIQNAWDEPGVTTVTINLDDHPVRGRSILMVTDDAPDGFADLTHAFTLFAPSNKVSDAAKRGRFNIGEKLLLAICDQATVVSTTGGWEFGSTGRKRLRRKRDKGSEIFAIVQLTDVERDQVTRLIETLLVPEGITTTLNGKVLDRRAPVREFTATLATEIADEEGILRKTRRQTTVRLFEPVGDEEPHIYEMGIPVVTHDGRFHIDVQQKVPLTLQRDNVTPAYLRELRVAVLNHAHDLVNADDSTRTWVKEATSDKRADPLAVSHVIKQRFGEKAVAYDPSDPDANAKATLLGYTVVHGRSLSGEEWAQAKRAGVLRPAGQVTPSFSKVESDPEGKPPMPVEDWRPGHHRVAEYARALAKDLIEVDLSVQIYNGITLGFDGAYRPGQLSLNQGTLGRHWFDEPDELLVDALLLHEFAHHRVHDHLSERFHDEVARLGAMLRNSSVRLEG